MNPGVRKIGGGAETHIIIDGLPFVAPKEYIHVSSWLGVCGGTTGDSWATAEAAITITNTAILRSRNMAFSFEETYIGLAFATIRFGTKG